MLPALKADLLFVNVQRLEDTQVQYIDRSDGQFFKAMEWRWLFFSNDGMAMVFENSHHHHRWFLAGSTIGSDGFSMVFPILGTNVSRWLQTEIRDKLRVNKT